MLDLHTIKYIAVSNYEHGIICNDAERDLFGEINTAFENDRCGD